MGWRCVSVRRRLALFVGDDLSAHESRAVEKHLTECPSCRDRVSALRRSREIMQMCRTEPSDRDISPSLWPTLRSQLTDREFLRRPHRSWLPTGAVAAATIAIGVVLWNRTAHLEPVSDRSSFPATAAADSSFVIHGPDSDRMIGRSADEDLAPGSAYFHLENAHPVGFAPGEF